MPSYSLKIDQQQRRLRTSARDRDETLAIFGKRLKLTLEEPMAFVAVYLLNESESDTHLLGDTTRVFATPI